MTAAVRVHCDELVPCMCIVRKLQNWFCFSALRVPQKLRCEGHLLVMSTCIQRIGRAVYATAVGVDKYSGYNGKSSCICYSLLRFRAGHGTHTEVLRWYSLYASARSALRSMRCSVSRVTPTMHALLNAAPASAQGCPAATAKPPRDHQKSCSPK